MVKKKDVSNFLGIPNLRYVQYMLRKDNRIEYVQYIALNIVEVEGGHGYCSEERKRWLEVRLGDRKKRKPFYNCI